MNVIYGKQAFIESLNQIGYPHEDKGDNRVAFPYAIVAGRFKDKAIMVGIEVPTDFPVTCPSGPHICPRLIPINPGAPGNDRAADSGFGPEWEYLSRPFVQGSGDWNRTTKDVKAYIKHVKRILETL